MEHQQCRHKDNVEEITGRNINGRPYIPLKYVNDRFDKIEQQNIRISEDVNKVLDKTNILKKQSDAILCQTFELGEFTVPRLFIVLPEDTPRYNPAHWFHLNYRLYFLCECDNGEGPHFGFHEGYEIKKPREFLRKYAPYLRNTLTVVTHALSAGSLIVPQLVHVASGIPSSGSPTNQPFWNNLSTRVQRLDAILTEIGKDHDISTMRNVQYVEGAELRTIESFLKKSDDHRKFGNLYRSVTNDGHVRWVCAQHYESHYSENVIKDLREKFQNLGGEMKGDVAILQDQFLYRFSEMIDVLRNGLLVYSVILNDINLKREDFDTLLSFISQQSVIRNLEIENMTVSTSTGKLKKRDIILQLEDTIRKNDKLNIQYSFTKSLSKFVPKLIDAITKTNSRLLFRVRSQEATPSLTLAGANETGFALSINNSDENSDNIYKTAIENIFELVPNITKIFLYNGAISESIWTCFYQFLTTKQVLQELTIDCRLTLEQTRQLSVSLYNHRTVKTLHMFNIWKKEEELTGCKDIFEMLQINTVLIEFILTTHADQLLVQLDSIATSLLQNKTLHIVRLPKCQIHQNTNIQVIEHFLQTTSIHKLSLELISTNCEAFLERLAHAVNKNETLEILELIGSESSAVFQRKKQILSTENNLRGRYPKWLRAFELIFCL